MTSFAWELAWGFLFWSSAGLLIYTYVGFLVVLALRAWLRPRPVKLGADTPSVSFLIPVHNEAAVIASKLDNVLALDYPAERLEIIVASDSSDDGTDETVAAYAARGVRLLRLPRQGKNAAVAAAAAEARGDLLVCSDADSMLTREALRHLVAPFADAEVGAVAGDYVHATDGDETVGERQYWSYDRLLKRLQSRAGSLTAVSGALYAVRRELFVAAPGDVTDDFYITAQVAAAHRRVVFAPQASAVGPVVTVPAEELERRTRIIGRGLRGVWRCRRLLNPFVYGFHAVQLLSHKVLRRFMVLPLIVLLVSSLALWPAGRLYRAAAVAQLALHAGAAAGYVLLRLGRRPPRILRVLLHFDLVNAACLAACAELASGRRRDRWETPRADAEAGAS